MAIINVRLKSTGQTGTVDDSEFSSQIYDLVDQPTSQPAPTPVTQSPQLPPMDTESSVGKFLLNAANNIISPFKETGKTLISGLGVAPLAVEADLVSKINPERGSQIAQEAQKISDSLGLNEGLKKAQDKPQEYLRQQAGNSAQLASYAVPFGKGAGVVQKALVPGAIAGGITGAGSALAQEGDVSPEKLVGKTAVGAGTGAATAGLLYGAGKLFNKAGESAQAKSDLLSEKNLKLTNAQRAKFYKETGETLSDFLKKRDLQGSNFDNVDEVTQKLQDQFDEIANSPDLRVNGGDIIKGLRDTADDLGKSTIPSDVSKAKVLQNIADTFEKSPELGSGEISGNVITELRKGIDTNVRDFGADAAVKSPLNTYRSVVQDAVRKAADEQGFTAGSQTLKESGQELSKLYKLLDLAGPRQFVNQSGLNIGLRDIPAFLGGNVVGGPVGGIAGVGLEKAAGTQAGANILSKGANIAGSVLSKQLPPIASNAINQGLIHAENGGGNPPELPSIPQGVNNTNNQSNQTTIDNSHMSDNTINTGQSQPETRTGYTVEQLAKAYTAALMDNNTAAATQIKNLYNLESDYQKGADQGDTENIISGLETLKQETASNLTDALNPLSSTGSYLQSQADILTQVFAKLIEKSRLSDKDRDFYLKQTKAQPLDLVIPGRYENRVNGVIDSLKTKLGIPGNAASPYGASSPVPTIQ